MLQAGTLTATAAVAPGTLTLGKEPASKKTQIVDSHVHVWKDDPQYPWPKELRQPPKEDALPSQLIRLMRENHVDRTVIVHVIYYRWDCRYAGDAIKADPIRFGGVCRVDPQAQSAPDDLTRWVRDYGYHGVRLSPYLGPKYEWINDRKQMDRIWSRAANLEVPMCILCPIQRIPDVERVIRRHPDLDVCIDHMAECPIDEPDQFKKLARLARYPRVHVKLSHLWSLSKQAYPYRDTFDRVKRLYDAFGPQRLMWGSDWPAVENFCGYAKALALYQEELEFLSPEDRRWILGGTALRLWPGHA
jgi:predicted TIM-barrel fold metal-dependent hydrolase